MLALLLALLPVGAWADAGFGTCPGTSGGKGKTLNLCLDSLKGLAGVRPIAPPQATAALPAAGDDGAPAADPPGSPGWSMSGSLLPDETGSDPQQRSDGGDADRLLQSLRLKQFMLHISRPF